MRHAILILVLFSSLSYSQKMGIEGKQILLQSAGLSYYLYLPKGFKTKDAWPLVIYLHGRGDCTTEKVLTWGPANRVSKGDQFPFILVTPILPCERWWTAEEIIPLLDKITNTLGKKVDADRISVTGLSMGGFGTWDLGVKFPERFSALAPICGGGDPSKAWRMQKIPVWTFHGDKDTVVSITKSEEMVDALRIAGGNIRFTVFPGVGHVSWPAVYDDPEFYKWLISHKRSKGTKPDDWAETSYAILDGSILKMENLLMEKPLRSGDFSILAKNITDKELNMEIRLHGNEYLSFNPFSLNKRIPPKSSFSNSVKVSNLKGEALHEAGLFEVETIITWKPEENINSISMTNRTPYEFSVSQTLFQTPTKITIDGNSHDWVTIPFLKGDIGQVQWNKEGFKGEKDLSYRYALALDKDFLHIAVDVTDNSLQLDKLKNVWEQDGVEIRIDPRPGQEHPSSKDWEEIIPILLSPGEKMGRETVWEKAKIPQEITYASGKTDKGHFTEISIPRKVLETFQASKDKKVRINIAIDDYDKDEPACQLWLFPDWRGSKTRSSSGTLILKNGP